jgi:hypothetical protein
MVELEKFISIIKDFTKDLTETYPEYAFLWKKWSVETIPESEQQSLYQYCIKTYPERFFDIIYQNHEIFDKESNENMCFLPNIDFRLLFLCEGVSEKTKKTIWKYLQLILFSIVNDVKDKTLFGESVNLFDGFDENILQEKLEDTMKGITDFFQHLETSPVQEEEEEEDKDKKDTLPNEEFEEMGGEGQQQLPDMKKVFEHLKGLFQGKIGSLATEMAEEISGDFIGLVDEDMKNCQDPKEIIQKLMKNPTKMMSMMKKVSNKLDSKIESGEISKEELMKEAGDIFSKMKDMGGTEQFKDMFEKMKKSMGGAGKNVRMDTSKLNTMMKQNEQRERLREKLEKKRNENILLNNGKNPNEMVFSIIGEEKQEKSFIHPDILKEMEKEEKQDEKKNKKKKSKQKK